MSKIVEDMINEEIRESNIVIAMRMLENGKLSVEEIANCVGMTVEEVKDLSEN